MKPKRRFPFRELIGLVPLFAGSAVCAAPLIWFPGPPLNFPISGAATLANSGLGNVLIGGESLGYPVGFPQSLTATNSTWTYQPAISSAHIAPGALDTGDTIVVYGGTDGTNSTSTVTDYSPSSDVVPALPSMSVPRSYLGYAPDGSGNGYAIGGLDDTGQPLASAERLNPDAGSWAPVASLPTALYNFPAVFDHTNGIFIFGGRTNTTTGTEVATVLRYSVNANTWTAMAPMPMAVAGSVAAFGADGKIYVVGGVSGGVTVNVVQVYDPAANSWVISTPLPQALSASSMGVDSLGRLIVMGGADANGNDVTNVWRSQQLGLPDSAPAFTHYPGTNGAYNVPYTSSINAIGNPQPIYLLNNGPAGMQVDTYTGVIAWTPQGGSEIGAIPVSLRATNYAGFVDWSFTITVTPPPPTTPTNLTVVSATDTSVTLSWAPENPLAGPVTFNIYLVTSTIHGGRIYTKMGTSSTNSVTLTGLQRAHTYNLVVTAVLGGSSTGYSQEVAARTTSPQPPPNVHLTDLTSTTFSLAWDPSPGPAQNPAFSTVTSYTISQFIPGGTIIPKVTGITNTSGTVTGLAPGFAAYWTVQAFDAQGYASLGYTLIIVSNPVPVGATVGGAASLSNGTFQFTVQEGGSVVQTVLIQANTDLANPNGWVQVGSVLPGSSLFTFIDTNASLYPKRFYRVVSP